jgi:hypothetical protein
MSTGRIVWIAMVIALFASGLPVRAQRGAGLNARRGTGAGTCLNLLAAPAQAALDATEAAELAYLREEEKLAHDVYSTLFSKWHLRIFENVSQSEQRHSDVLALLLNRYGLTDPAAGKAAGDFEDPGLQTLYSDLVAQGQASLMAALRAGATIEDLSFHNLGKAVAATDNGELMTVYQNLQGGTRNHMQMFVRQLEAGGGSYAAQYVSAATLAQMLSMSYDAGTAYGRRRGGRRGIARGAGTCIWNSNPAAD